MRAFAILVALVIAVSCGAPGTGSVGGSGPLSADPKRILLETRFVDARRSESFTLGQFSGKVVIVMGIAVW